MSTWQILVAIVHSSVCLAIVVMAMELMNQRREDPTCLLGRVAYYLVLVGAFGYLVEPFAGMPPTLSDLMFETGVALYLAARKFGRPAPYVVRRR